MISLDDLEDLKRQLDYAKTNAHIEVTRGMEYLSKYDNLDNRNYVNQWKMNVGHFEDAIYSLSQIKIL